MHYETPRYRKWLEEEWTQRSERNPSYSMSAYARDLGLSPASMSRVLNGEQGLSLDRAERIIKALELSETEAEQFRTEVAAHSSRSKLKKKLATAKLHQIQSETAVNVEAFQQIGHWSAFAILESLELKSPPKEARDFAEKFGISVNQAMNSLQALESLGLIKKGSRGQWQKNTQYVRGPDQIPNRLVRNYHRTIISKAETALETVAIENRDFSSVIFSVNQADLAWAKEKILEFRKQLTSQLAKRSDKDSIYQLSIQLFPLTKEKSL
jgi:uncharacterized protein (TIGR02147 family)